MDSGTQQPPIVAAGLARRCGAILYDALLLGSVLFLATIPAVMLTGGTAVPPGNHVYFGYLSTLSFLYFAWPWTHGGQTLGMRCWRIRVCTLEGTGIGWPAALLRFVCALISWLPLGLGFVLVAFHPQRRALHDLLSRTLIAYCPKLS